ncbi:MAG: hypothetical protein DLM52_04050 [Chthoniobacterales bacterium]|nr:MAG: hypothetical protein DLM52_04050 [Chthoniobacterales bacterium]
MPRQHVWTEREDDGVKREVRATWFGGVWRLQSKRADEEKWTYHEQPLQPDLLTLQELIARKYRRRRATIDELNAVEKLVRQCDSNT